MKHQQTFEGGTCATPDQHEDQKASILGRQKGAKGVGGGGGGGGGKGGKSVQEWGPGIQLGPGIGARDSSKARNSSRAREGQGVQRKRGHDSRHMKVTRL